MGIGKDEHMSFKWIGAICIVAGCGGCGYLMAAQHMAKIRQLQNLIAALDYMRSDLQYRCTPLPQLCRQAGQLNQGKIKQIFILLADELEAQISPNVHRCMATVLDKLGAIDQVLHGILMELGLNLGRFDMNGQLRILEYTQDLCRENLTKLTQNKDSRLRSYQTLGLCAGAALAILFV